MEARIDGEPGKARETKTMKAKMQKMRQDGGDVGGGGEWE